MPTNKLWIEHTERAAWQSVQALREKLAEAERRAERMAPPAAGWRELFDALDAARDRHVLAGESYAELIRDLLERSARIEAERRSAETRREDEAAPLAFIQPARAARSKHEESVDWDDDEPSFAPERPSRFERRLFDETRRRARELGAASPGPDFYAALSEIETRLADLPGLDTSEVFEIAADLAALALCLGRGRPRRDE